MGELFEIYGEFDFGHKPCDMTLRSNNRASIMTNSPSSVIRRGRSPFKHKDVLRAAKSAKAAGLAIGGIEVVTKDGVTIRILAKTEAGQSTDTPENIIAKL
jgi:hypothetical protein